jgi:hypothetical protein
MRSIPKCRAGLTFKVQRPAVDTTTPSIVAVATKLGTGLAVAQSILGTNAPARLIAGLIEVALTPGITRIELAQRMGMPINTAMRDLKTLSTERRNGSPGLGLVAERWDTIAARHLTYTLTARGVEAVNGIADSLSRA